MERSESTVGPDCLNTLWAKDSLGRSYELDDQLKEARDLHTDALKGQKSQLGPDHSHTVWIRHAVARLEERNREGDEKVGASWSQGASILSY